VDIPEPDPSRKRHRSNQTHTSDSDPDARLARKPNKPTDMYYQGHISVDSAQGVVVAALADYGDKCEHESLAGLINQSLANLSGYKLALQELLADSKYNTHHTLQICESAGITPYMNNPSGYKPDREGFLYDEASDSYRCPQGHPWFLRQREKAMTNISTGPIPVARPIVRNAHYVEAVCRGKDPTRKFLTVVEKSFMIG